MSAVLTVSILNGVQLAPGAWAEVKFTTSDMPYSNTSAMCKYEKDF